VRERESNGVRRVNVRKKEEEKDRNGFFLLRERGGRERERERERE
jgi:hypothetical protein